MHKPRMASLLPPNPERETAMTPLDDNAVANRPADQPPSAWSLLDTVLAAGKKLLSVAVLALLLAAPAHDALAARGGGRVGGSSFRAPATRSAPRPSRSYGGGGGGGGFYSPPSMGYGYGYGAPSLLVNPFVAPIGLGLGLGNVFFLAAFFAGSVVVSNVLQVRNGGADPIASPDPTTAVSLLKVGLLSSARTLQLDLDALARSADTSTPRGLAAVLSDTVTALLRHPDFWTHGSTTVRAFPLSKAEGEFNRAALEERLKLDEETLSNYAGRRREDDRARATESDMANAPSEYIVVVMAVAAAGDLVKRLPKQIDGVKDLERALKAFATVSMDSVQAVEIIWAPQSLKDTVTEAEMLADHPELKRL